MVPSVVRFQFHSNYVISADSVIHLVALLTLFVQPRPELGPVHEAPRVAHDTFEDTLGCLETDFTCNEHSDTLQYNMLWTYRCNSTRWVRHHFQVIGIALADKVRSSLKRLIRKADDPGLETYQ